MSASDGPPWRYLRVALVAGAIFVITRASLHAYVSAGDGVPVLGIDVSGLMPLFYAVAVPVFFPTVVVLHGVFRWFPGLMTSADGVEALVEIGVSLIWAILLCRFLGWCRPRSSGSHAPES